nr:tetratricopeptide repeat protein [Ornithinimicrobium sp. F0845]
MMFSDIEGSTKLLQELGPRYREVLSDQRRIMRAAVAAHRGHEMGTEGDSFYVVFSSAVDAVRAAVQAQAELVRVATGADHLRVRIGLHTGEPDRHEDGYVGLDVHRAARVAAAANGGQIVLTAQTWALVRGKVAGTAKDLGRHRLKDISTPEHLLRLVPAGLEDEDRPLRTVGATASLPTPPNSLVAREGLVASVDTLLRHREVRLASLVGPGGVGKTRVAIAAAQRCADWVTDGVFFVGLADVRSNDDVWTAIADVTGAPATERSPADLLRWLRDRSVLLVLDNVEQLPQIHEVVSQLIAGTTEPEVLLTSRRPLHVLGERLIPVPPLDPDDAVELFVERLAAVRPGEPPDRAVVRELCARVDGMPLAIELLAARGQLLGPEAMLDRLTDGLDLRSRSMDRPDRQRSLRAVLDWSYRLLDPPTGTAFRQLGALAGTFGLADACAVLGVEEDDALEALLDLVEASLVMAVEAPGGAPEFRLLRVVGTYALRLLEQDEKELVAVRSRLAGWAHEWAQDVVTGLRSQAHLATRDRLGRRQELIRRVLEESLRPGSPDAVVGLELCADLTFYWYSCGYAAEGAKWLSRAQQASEGLEDVVVSKTLHGLAIILMQQGQVAEAETLLRRLLATWTALGEDDRSCITLNSLALARRMQGDMDEAGELFREAIQRARASESDKLQVNAMSNLALLELDRGSPSEALGLMRETLALDTRLGDPWGVFADHVNISTALLVLGDAAEAGRVLLQHGPGGLGLGDTDLSLEIVENLACVCAAEGLDENCARMIGAAAEGRRAAVLPRLGPDLERLETLLADSRARLGPRWEVLAAGGSDLGLEGAFEMGVRALAATDRVHGAGAPAR